METSTSGVVNPLLEKRDSQSCVAVNGEMRNVNGRTNGGFYIGKPPQKDVLRGSGLVNASKPPHNGKLTRTSAESDMETIESLSNHVNVDKSTPSIYITSVQASPEHPAERLDGASSGTEAMNPEVGITWDNKYMSLYQPSNHSHYTGTHFPGSNCTTPSHSSVQGQTNHDGASSASEECTASVTSLADSSMELT